MTDWAAWHEPYEDLDSPLSGRLREVRRQVAAALDRAPAGPLTLLSLCAGQGLDVLPVLTDHGRGPDVAARLVELDERNCAAARKDAPTSATVQEADAGDTASYAEVLPVDVLLLCGIFGNIDDADVARTVAAVPTLCKADASIVWTRHTHPPDLTPRLRHWFGEIGIETAFVREPDVAAGWSVGTAVLESAADAPPPARLFTFTRRPS